ncbi:MAG: ABC transporter permease subunit [Xanthomonadales bacterium]|nr:ABC transporter permease subunit [Xanthomonadales bacterium]
MKKSSTPSWIWSLVGITLLLAAWEVGHRVYGALVLPGLDDTLRTLLGMIGDGLVGPALAETAGHALTGWLIGVSTGVLVGTLAGLRDAVRAALQPVAIILLGIPAIAWVVMALLWFGGDWAVVFTIAVATGPLVFAPAVEGVRSLDGGLIRMARVYRVPFGARLLHMHAPHMASHLYPALATTLAMAWKVAIMAELLAGAGGIGDGIAGARARIDTAGIMAWVVVVACVLVVVDLWILRPVQRRLWVWRDDADGGRS